MDADPHHGTLGGLCGKKISQPIWSIDRAPEYNKKLWKENRMRLEDQKRKRGNRIEPFRFQLDDMIQITISSRPELTRSVTLNENGEFDYLYNIRNIKAAGLTLDELRNVLKERLSPFIQNPAIVLRPSNIRCHRLTNLPTRDILFIKNDYSSNPTKISPGATVFEFLLSQAGGPSEFLGSKCKEAFIIRIDWKTMDLILVVCDVNKFLYMIDMNQDIQLKSHDIIYLPTKADTANEIKKQLEFLNELMKKVEAVITHKTFRDFEKQIRTLEKENSTKTHKELLDSLK